MSDFLLELRSEEIPARMQAGARADLERLFRKEMEAAGVAMSDITVWSTPRRLALIARSLPQATAAVSEEVKGPRTSAPEQALEGFLRKTGLGKDQLVERDGVWFAISEKPGRATRDVLAEAIPAIVRQFPWPKSMRWGAASLSTESTRWVRPLSGIVAILGEDLVECEAGGVRSGFATKGHRFHHPGEITIGGAADYQDKLRACHVLVDHAERQDLIRDRARAAAGTAGLSLVADEGLVVENAGLTEWPVPLLGRFDEGFLEVPPEVIQLTARINQKYFVCEFPSRLREGSGEGLLPSASPTSPPPSGRGELANAFVCTANIDATDGGEAIVAGNRKVLAARLSDARFFWEQDRKKTLAQHAGGLARITFHEKLGTVADKVDRVARLAEWLAREGIVPNCDPALARRAAELCKADLVTEMVGEFPELQGLMGGYYARAEGLPDAVADAIRDHYKPVGQGDDVPAAPVTVAVSLADKLDTIFSFFLIQERPTGSKDPFALRRAALGILALLCQNSLRLPLLRLAQRWEDEIVLSCQVIFGTHGNYILNQGAARQIVAAAAESASKMQSGEWVQVKPTEVKLQPDDDAEIKKRLDVASTMFMALDKTFDRNEILAFFADRLKVQQREAGVRHDLIDAVFALGGEDDLVRLLARVHALQAFVGTRDGANLLAGYKRAANILKKEGFEGEGVIALSYTPEPAEKALIEALGQAGPQAAAAVAAEDFAGAMAALASLRAPIDAFFDSVTVNDADAVKRQARLGLLAQFRDAVHQVADFSKIEG